MKDTTRARVAAVIAAVARNRKVSAVFDYDAGSYRNASAEIRSGRVHGFDYGTSSHFSGRSPGKLDFFDYETSSHVQLKIDGDKFNGFDHYTGSHFSGSMRGSSVSVFDYGTGQHHNYGA